MHARKSIKATVRIASSLIIITLLISVVATALGVNIIRLGGAMDNKNQINSEFVSDILPPPLFLIEPMLHATLIASDPEEIEPQEKILAELEKNYRIRLEYWKISKLSLGLVQRLNGRLTPIGDRFFNQLHRELIPAGRTGDPSRINAAHDRLEAIYSEYKREANELVREAQHENTAGHALSEQISFGTVIGLSLIGLALVSQLFWTMRMLNRRALTPLAQTAITMKRMAAGDLDAGRTSDHQADEIGDMTRAIEVFRASAEGQRDSAKAQQAVVVALRNALSTMANGQLGVTIVQPFADDYEPLRQSFNETVVRLGGLIHHVARSAHNVHNGASEILRAADDLAMRNERQAGTVEETAAAMRQVTSIVAQSARATVGVRDTISATHEDVVSGGATVERMVSTMSEVEASSRDINQIISVIEGLSFQTNLLALNAGVEAARAGEAGRGFAVVATEVRALAQRSSDAAKQIGDLIKRSTLRVNESSQLVGETGELLTTIVDRMGKINASANEIARSAEKQAESLGHVNGSVVEMDQVTQKNAAMVEQTSAAARSLAQEAERLSELVSRFSVKDSDILHFMPRKLAGSMANKLPDLRNDMRIQA